MHRTSIHNHHTCARLPYTTITLAQGYYTQPPHMHAATAHTHHTCTCYCIHLQTPCTTKVTPIYTQCRYHTHEPYTPIPTLYMYHTSRHTLTYVCVCVCVPQISTLTSTLGPTYTGMDVQTYPSTHMLQTFIRQTYPHMHRRHLSHTHSASNMQSASSYASQPVSQGHKHNTHMTISLP